MDRRQRRRIGIIVAVVLLLGCLPAAAFGVFMLIGMGGARATAAQYREIADRSEQRAYVRPEDPPGWELEPGSAAELYREAWGACDLGGLYGGSAAHDAMIAAQMALGRRSPGILTATPDIPAGWTLPPACAEAGAPADHVDPAVAQLTEEVCLTVVECRPALELMRRASRRQDSRSPTFIWDPWSFDRAASAERSATPFSVLVRLEIIDGHLAYLGGDRSRRIAGAASVMRNACDLRNGSGLIGAVLANVLIEQGGRRLDRLMFDGDLTAAELRTAADEVGYVRRQPLDWAASLEAEYLMLVGLLLAHRSDVRVPPAYQPFVGQGQFWLTMTPMIGHIRDNWDDIFAAIDQPFPERCAAWSDVSAQAQSSSLASMFTYDPGTLDARMTTTAAYVALLQVALVDTARLAEGRAPAADAAALAAAEPGLDVVDPLTGEPFALTVDEHQHLRAWSSRYLDPAYRASHGLIEPSVNLVIDDWLVLRVPLSASPAGDQPQPQLEAEARSKPTVKPPPHELD